MNSFFDGRKYFRNLGPAERLVARLDHRGAQWVLCVCVVVRFNFEVLESARLRGIPEWTEDEQDKWIDSFITSAENSWSYQWSLQRLDVVQDTKDLYQKPFIVEVELVVEEFDEARTCPSSKNRLYDVFVTRGTNVQQYGGKTFEGLGQVQVAEEHAAIAPSPGGKG